MMTQKRRGIETNVESIRGYCHTYTLAMIIWSSSTLLYPLYIIKKYSLILTNAIQPVNYMNLIRFKIEKLLRSEQNALLSISSINLIHKIQGKSLIHFPE